MKYTQEMSDKLVADYQSGRRVEEMAAELNVPKRSVIAKLSSLGVYKAKTYVNKRGEQPIKKEEHIIKVASLLGIDVNLLDSMEKVTKTALVLIEEAIKKQRQEAADEIQYWKDEAKVIEKEYQDEIAVYERMVSGKSGIDVHPFGNGIAANAPLKTSSITT